MPKSASVIASYIAVVTGLKAEVQEDTLILHATSDQASEAVAGFFRDHIIEEGAVSGIKSREVPVYGTRMVEAPIYLPACWDGPEPEPQMVEETYQSGVRYVPDFVDTAQTGRRLDMTYDARAGILLISGDIFEDQAVEALQESATAQISARPAQNLTLLVGAEKASGLTRAFNEIAALGSLSPDDALDPAKAADYALKAGEAKTRLTAAVKDADLTSLLGETATLALVKKHTGMSLNFDL